ncbi:MAG TPA: hypothetical protein VG369_03595 [Humibacter sp.]|jgi:hypothetical protein|nr:hypothetical protein [Humibacter sp.]
MSYLNRIQARAPPLIEAVHPFLPKGGFGGVFPEGWPGAAAPPLT